MDLQLLTLDSFKQACADARLTTMAKNEHQWLRAIERAEARMLRSDARWYFDGRVLKVHSSTRTSTTMYTVTPRACTCEAFRRGLPCWHRAARRLLVRAMELARKQLEQQRYAELTTELDELLAA